MCFLKKGFYCSTFHIKVCDPSQINFCVLCGVKVNVRVYRTWYQIAQAPFT